MYVCVLFVLFLHLINKYVGYVGRAKNSIPRGIDDSRF